MDDIEKQKAKAATAGKIQIGFAIATFMFTLLVSLPSISSCMAGEYWGCFVLEHDTSFILGAAGAVGVLLVTLGILNLRRVN